MTSADAERNTGPPKRRRKRKKARKATSPGKATGSGGPRQSGTETRPGPGQKAWWRRWWATLSAAVLAAGALASAISAVIALWPQPSPPDVEEDAEITSISFVPVALSEYEYRAPNITMRSLGKNVEYDLAALPLSTSMEPPSGTPAGPTPPATSTPSTPPTATSTETSATATPSETSPTVSPTETTSGASPSESSPTGVAAATEYEEVVDEKELAYYVLPDADQPEAAPMESLVETVSIDAHGDPVSKEVAARRLVRVLGHTRTVAQSDGRLDPLGVLVDANLHLQGLRDRTLDLRWSIYELGASGGLSVKWLREVEASHVIGHSDDYTVAVDFWVPMPKRRGDYVLRLTVTDGDTRLHTKLSDPFGR